MTAQTDAPTALEIDLLAKLVRSGATRSNRLRLGIEAVRTSSGLCADDVLPLYKRDLLGMVGGRFFPLPLTKPQRRDLGELAEFVDAHPTWATSYQRTTKTLVLRGVIEQCDTGIRPSAYGRAILAESK